MNYQGIAAINFKQLPMKIFLEPDKLKTKEKKVMYSTSLPKSLKGALQEAVTVLHRNKADWIRAALDFFIGLDEKNQEHYILNTYRKIDNTQLRPFTTTLLESQLINLNILSSSLKRSKAEILRTSIFIFSSKSLTEQEKMIKNFISR